MGFHQDVFHEESANAVTDEDSLPPLCLFPIILLKDPAQFSCLIGEGRRNLCEEVGRIGRIAIGEHSAMGKAQRQEITYPATACLSVCETLEWMSIHAMHGDKINVTVIGVGRIIKKLQTIFWTIRRTSSPVSLIVCELVNFRLSLLLSRREVLDRTHIYREANAVTSEHFERLGYLNGQ